MAELLRKDEGILKKQLTIPSSCFIIPLVRAGVVQW